MDTGAIYRTLGYFMNLIGIGPKDIDGITRMIDEVVIEIEYDPEDGSQHMFMNVIELVLKNRKAVLHIYKSANRDFFEQYHWRVCDQVVNTYLSKKFQNIQISDLDRTVLVAYIKSLVFGTVMGWLENDLQDDIEIYVHRICELKQGDLDAIIEKCKIS